MRPATPAPVSPVPKPLQGQADILGRRMSLEVPLAHLGHWYLWIPYVIPVVVVLAASLHAFRQQRREDRERDAAETSRP